MKQKTMRLTVVVTVTALLSSPFTGPNRAFGNPIGAEVKAGAATVETGTIGTTPTVTIRQTTPTAIINWQSFNIAQGELTQFIQPSATAMVLNRIGGLTPSMIDGALHANGIVFLLNRNGIIFGQNAQINVGGLVASSLHMTDADFLTGMFRFSGEKTDGLIKNLGNIRAGVDGVYLFAPNVENHGIITSPNGTITLAAGSTAYLSNRPDGRGFLTELQAPAGQALNVGQMIADGGNITMAGLVVNQNGLVQANAVQSRNGRIELIAKQAEGAGTGDPAARVALGSTSTTTADGGTIAISGQQVVHDGLLQANHTGTQQGSVQIKAGAGAQAGSGSISTGSGSRMLADGGDILLDGRTIVHDGIAQAHSVNQKGTVGLKATDSITTGAASEIAANGGQVTIEGRQVTHRGLLQSNGSGTQKGSIKVTGKDSLTTESGSRMTADGGDIGLEGGTIAHNGLLQAHSTGSLKGTVDIQSGGAVTTGSASQILADGGDIVIEGKTIDHHGLTQANTVGERQGHIAYMAKDALTLRGTSRTHAKGGATGASDGGTIIGMASNLSTGQAQVESSAELDVSAGQQGGIGGTVWLGDGRQSLTAIGTGTLRGTAQANLIQSNLTVSSLPASGQLRDVSLVALNDLTVTGNLDLATLAPGAPRATLRFFAGNNLKFENANIHNGLPFEMNLGTLAPRDLVGVAGNDVTLGNRPGSFDPLGSILTAGDGGNISLFARNGKISLIDPVSGSLSSIHVRGGGNLDLIARKDIITSLRVADELRGAVDLLTIDSNVQGILVDGTMVTGADGSRTGSGKLTMISKDGSFLGGQVRGSTRGPGFMVRNADAEVSVRGTIGSTNLPLDANGMLPDALGLEQLAPLVEDRSNYLDLSMNNAKVSMTSQGNIYLRRARDSGITSEVAEEFGSAGGAYEWGHGNPDEPQTTFLGLSNGFQHNRLALTSEAGNVFVNTRRLANTQTGWDAVSEYLPAFVDLKAGGTIQFRTSTVFFNAPSGRLNFSAGRNIEGLPPLRRVPPADGLYEWVYVQDGPVNPNPQIDRWVAIDLRQPIPPALQRWRGVAPPHGVASKPEGTALLPASFFTTTAGDPPSIKLLRARPEDLIGLSPSDVERGVDNVSAPNPTSPTGLIQFKADSGNIRNLSLSLIDMTYRKEIVLKAGGDIERVQLTASVPTMGTEAKTITEQVPLIKDPQTGQFRPLARDSSGRRNIEQVVRDDQTGQYRLLREDGTLIAQNVEVIQVPVEVTVNLPKPAVRIEAGGNINLSRAFVPQGNEAVPLSGFNFTGDGVVQIRVGGNLDLGDGQGIRFNPGTTVDGPTSKNGLLDIGVGNNLLMSQSRIRTDGGAGISIHGRDWTYIPGYDNSALHPLEIPMEMRGQLNEAPLRGRIDVGLTVKQAEGSGLDPTGILVTNGGSVGVKSVVSSVTQGTTPAVNVAVQRDPVAIRIQAQGDVNVNTSRIATLSGGDIHVASTDGSINAGSGGKDEQIEFGLDVPKLDANGNPIIDEGGRVVMERINPRVPGSGIFTFHPSDPQTINFPKFDTPAMTALKNEIFKQKFFGRDTSSLEAQFEALSKARVPEFDAIFEKFIAENPDKPEFVNGQRTGRFLPLELGDVTLNAGKDIVVPPAGIRGRRVDLIAGQTLDFQGGEVQGKVTFKAKSLTGDVKVTGTFAGTSAGGGAVSIASSGGGGSVGGLSGVTGTVAATSASTSASVSSAQKATESVQEAGDASSQPQNRQTAKKSDGKEGDTKKKSFAMRARRGVEIEVDVRSKPGPSGG